MIGLEESGAAARDWIDRTAINGNWIKFQTAATGERLGPRFLFYSATPYLFLRPPAVCPLPKLYERSARPCCGPTLRTAPAALALLTVTALAACLVGSAALSGLRTRALAVELDRAWGGSSPLRGMARAFPRAGNPRRFGIPARG